MWLSVTWPFDSPYAISYLWSNGMTGCKSDPRRLQVTITFDHMTYDLFTTNHWVWSRECHLQKFRKCYLNDVRMKTKQTTKHPGNKVLLQQVITVSRDVINQSINERRVRGHLSSSSACICSCRACSIARSTRGLRFTFSLSRLSTNVIRLVLATSRRDSSRLTPLYDSLALTR